MPSSFGSLVSVTLSADGGGVLAASEGLNGGARRRAGPGVDADAAFGRRKTVGVLGSGALAGVVLGMAAGLAAAAFAVQRGVAARAAAGKDADKGAQLSYAASTEGEVARELAAEGRLAPDEVVGGAELLRAAAAEERGRENERERERERERRAGAGGGGGGGAAPSGSEGGRAAEAAEAGGGAPAPASSAPSAPWVRGWLSALERAGGGALRRGAGVGRVGAGLFKGIVTRPRSAAAAAAAATGAAAARQQQLPEGADAHGPSPPSPAPMAAGSPAFLERGASQGGAGGADVAAYATAVGAPPGAATTAPRRASKA
jgi:hypothetical protein